MNKEIYEKIIAKKEFSQLPKKDVEIAFKHFDKEIYADEDKFKKTRDLLRKVFSVFTSSKLLNPKNKDVEWILKKHISTRERMDYCGELYGKLLRDFANEKKVSIIDLGAGINGLSYDFFGKAGFDVDYTGVEAVGQLVSLMNTYFKKEKKKGKAIHESLFDLNKIKEIIRETKKPRIVFLFKVIDSLEMLERDYSKKLLKEIVPLADRVVVSFATRSLVRQTRFKVKRYWFENFVKENFHVLEDFEKEGERYLVFEISQSSAIES